MSNKALKEIEAIHTRTFGRGARTIGVTGPEPQSGTTTIAKSLATRCALGGQETLLVDMSRGPDDRRYTDEHGLQEPEQPSANVFKARGGYDVLPMNPQGADKYRFRDAKGLQEMLKTDLAAYDQIVVDLSPVPDLGHASVPSGIGAAACDAVVVVLRTCVVHKNAVTTAMQNLAANEAKIAGIVMNDQNNPTIAEEFAREMDRFRWFLPMSVRRFLSRKVSSIGILNKKL